MLCEDSVLALISASHPYNSVLSHGGCICADARISVYVRLTECLLNTTIDLINIDVAETSRHSINRAVMRWLIYVCNYLAILPRNITFETLVLKVLIVTVPGPMVVHVLLTNRLLFSLDELTRLNILMVQLLAV